VKIDSKDHPGPWALGCALVLGLLVLPGLVLPVAAQDPLAERLRARLEEAIAQPTVPLAVLEEAVHARTTLLEFYEGRLYAPAWSRDGALSPAVAELVSVIEGAGSHGLRPGYYHLAALEELLPRVSRADRAAAPVDRGGALVDLDLLLTDAFLVYGAHLVSGRVNPETFDPEWVATRREVPLRPLLEAALGADGSVRGTLATLLPQQPGYQWLRQGLAQYRYLAATGGWSPVPMDGETLEPGATDPRVPALRRRLTVTGDLTAPAGGAPTSDESAGKVYDETLLAAVQRFQERHGLGPDGRVGAKTLTALNVSAQDRVGQIELNLERWRWLPRDLGARHLRVNIPDFTLQLMEDGQPTLSMRVIVGRAYRRTPVFSDQVRYLVLNPYWEVPTKLAVEDKLPEIRKDVGYLERLGFKVYEGWGAEQRPVDPTTVDWAALGKGRFPYRLRQDPGPQNALGKVKFMFPNKFNVYLHDTPTRELFARTDRDQSSGCIRLEKPLELAELLLRGSASSPSSWNRAALDAALATGQERTVALPSLVPVHMLYSTAWAEEGRDPATPVVHFRNDPYGRDAVLAAALATAPPIR